MTMPRTYTPDRNDMPVEEFIRLVAEMRDSQKRWPDHPQQACIETMVLERRVDEAMATGILLNVDPPSAQPMTGASGIADPDT